MMVVTGLSRLMLIILIMIVLSFVGAFMFRADPAQPKSSTLDSDASMYCGFYLGYADLLMLAFTAFFKATILHSQFTANSIAAILIMLFLFAVLAWTVHHKYPAKKSAVKAEVHHVSAHGMLTGLEWACGLLVIALMIMLVWVD